MIKTEYFQALDGIRLFCRWHDAGPDTPCMLILHGHGEHSARYEELFEMLIQKGWSFAALDHRGHGLSDGERVFVESFGQFLSDVSRLIEVIPEWFQRRVSFSIFGHSLGGLMAVTWANINPEKINAILLSSPCLGLNLPAFLIGFNKWIRKLNPSFVYRNPVYPPYLTHNLSEVKKYKSDNLIQRRITSSLLDEMITACCYVKDIFPKGIDKPLYIFMAEEEKVVDVRQTLIFFDRVASPSKKIFKYPGFYHEILHELGKEKVLEDIASVLPSIVNK